MRPIGVIVVVVCVGCGEARSPVQPTAPIQYSLRGLVRDTAFGGLADARVEVVDGPQAGAFAMTDHLGQFKMPDPLSDRTTVRASKEGYLPATQTIHPLNGAVFHLETTAPSLDITGEYIWTLTADRTCTQLPDVARTRTYMTTIAPHDLPREIFGYRYKAVLRGATFYPSGVGDVRFGVSGTVVRFQIGEYYELGIIEEVASTLVSIWGGGSGDGSVSGSSISGSMAGSFHHCASPVAPGGPYWGCPVPPVNCESGNHRFTLTRRAS